MTKEEKQQALLADFIETTSTITCSKCKKSEDYYMCDSYDAVEIVHREGWYATGANAYCPNCDKKRKKKK